MIGIGFVAAYFMTEYRPSKQGLDSDKIISLAGWTIIAGLICAKLLYYVTIFDMQEPELRWDRL
ncbi:prolipoprotein diacylglyceryl transferase [[Clostridium] symbiosum]|uniref:prolipoprotein diacylglyceryl transferase family protein n=1 Tax=Clostridium symbiosum TaxID=1512 RepID=UPI00210BC627|nr:prolipoprotein diacylglyceryl transferase family protein [[Clostridium] symbiosum]MCQ4838221.1 prolipoprotein diacylglyceryl transferase [[Clostridium] symbiosum]